MFDPFDPIVQEYRGYIGYRSADGKDYLGLLPGQSITVNVPLAFWDAGRLIISTDSVVSPGGSDLLGPDPNASPADQRPSPTRSTSTTWTPSRSSSAARRPGPRP